MTEIKKYSKEWFATSASQKQKDAAKKISAEQMEELKKQGKLSDKKIGEYTLFGTKEGVSTAYQSIQNNPRNAKECQLIEAMGGIDNLFDLLDENGDGIVMLEEIQSAAGYDTAQWAENPDMTLSANDLYNIYKNAVIADGAKVQKVDNTTTYEYKNGSVSMIETDDKGDIKTEYYSKKMTNKTRVETYISHKDKSVQEITYDDKGRVISDKTDKPGTMEDITITTSYKNNERTETIVTDFMTEKTTYRSDNSIKNRATNIKTEQTKTEVAYDELGRIVYDKVDKKGTLNDKEVKTVYTDTGREETVRTIGRTSKTVYDTNNNVTSKQEEYRYDSNGVIENSEQQSIGDCWLLSQLNAISGTTVGKQVIQDSIHKNPDGTVTVELKGVGKSYTYTPEQICSSDYGNTDKKYSKGDADMKLFELAFTDWRKEQIAADKDTFSSKYSERASLEDPLRGGKKAEVAEVLLGLRRFYTDDVTRMGTYLDNKMDNPERYAMVTSFKTETDEYGLCNDKPTITTGHQYSIKRVTADTVYVVNPWDSSQEIAYPREEFLQNACDIAKVDMNEYRTQNRQQ